KVSAFALPNQAALAAAYRFLARRRSVFALTSHYEPFGLGPLEAAVAGLPVVATQNGGPSDSLRVGKEAYGILVDPADPASIAGGLEQVVGNAQAWEQFAHRGRQHVLKHYTWERVAEDYLTLIEQIVASSAARSPKDLLPIHPYFNDPRPETDISLSELSHLYFGS
ncbi:MAG TPA: glycosyltransferase, partial [Candidatus Caenarcaniphilales bacterium]